MRWMLSRHKHERLLKNLRRDNAGKRARFEAVMDAVDGELERGGGPYFMGAELSLVECVFAPMLERIAASIPYYKGLAVRGTGCAACVFGLLFTACSPTGAHTLL